jgi:hypothetical protein
MKIERCVQINFMSDYQYIRKAEQIPAEIWTTKTDNLTMLHAGICIGRLSMHLFKFMHCINQGCHTFFWHSIVNGSTETAHRTVAFYSDHAF